MAARESSKSEEDQDRDTAPGNEADEASTDTPADGAPAEEGSEDKPEWPVPKWEDPDATEPVGKAGTPDKDDHHEAPWAPLESDEADDSPKGPEVDPWGITGPAADEPTKPSGSETQDVPAWPEPEERPKPAATAAEAGSTEETSVAPVADAPREEPPAAAPAEPAAPDWPPETPNEYADTPFEEAGEEDAQPPASTEPTGGWSVVAPKSSGPQAVAKGGPSDSDFVQHGLPQMRAAGWGIFLAGFLALAYAQWFRYVNDPVDPYQVAGLIRADVLGAILMIFGGLFVVIFSFVPFRRPFGLAKAQSSESLHRLLALAKARLAASRTAATVGWVTMLIGLSVVTGILYLSLNNDAEYVLTIGSYELFFWRIGGAVAVAGALLWIFAYAKLRPNRDVVQGLVAVSRAGSAAPAPGAQEGVAGVSPEDVKAVMKRIDALLAHLPDDEVSRFANSPEAQAYLKILES